MQVCSVSEALQNRTCCWHGQARWCILRAAHAGKTPVWRTGRAAGAARTGFLISAMVMSLFDPVVLVLLGVAVLGIVSHNTAVAVAMFILLIVRLTPLNQYFPWIEKNGLTIGIILLLVGVMAPIASGKISTQDLLNSLTQWKSLLAVVVGIGVAWLGGRGVPLMMSQPGLVPGLMIGTVIGVALFKGVPVGPLIAAGILAILMGKW